MGMVFSSKKNTLLIVGSLVLFYAPCAEAGTYASSAHGNSTAGVDRSSVDGKFSSYAIGNCGHCHEQHASIEGAEPIPVGGAPSPYATFATDQALCLECHDVGGPASSDISSSYARTYGHGSGNVSHPDTPLACNECHDPHVAKTTHSEATGGNLVQDAGGTYGSVIGSAGVSVNWSTPTTPGRGTEQFGLVGYTPQDPIEKEYELCLKCHGDQAVSLGIVDIAVQINPHNYAAHPVGLGTGDQWKNAHLRANAGTILEPPWSTNVDAAMYCSDCHQSDTVTDKGPHGSNIVYMLRAIGNGGNGDTKSYDDLCFLCHQQVIYTTNQDADSNFTTHAISQHLYSPAGQNTMGCIGCHGGGNANFIGRRGAIHGNNYLWANVGADPGNTGRAFLVGGYLTENFLDSKGNQCAAYASVAGAYDGGTGSCSMGAKAY